MASGPEPDTSREDHFASPGRLLLATTAAAFATQMLLTLTRSSPEPPFHGLLDALVLSLALLPVLYFCIFRPARRHEAQRRRVREGLEHSEERYRLLAENAADVIWARELDLSVSYVSPSVERLRGFTPEEAREQSLDESMPPDSARRVREMLGRIMAWAGTAAPEEIRQHSETLELELYRKDGSTVWTEVTVRFLMDRDGRPAKLIGVTRDITEWRRTQQVLKEGEQQFRVLFEQAGDAMFVQDWPSGQILDVNERACEALGYTREGLLGLSVSEIDAAWPKDKVTEFLGSLEPRRSETLEGTFKRKDGHTYPVEIRIALIQFRGQRRVLAVARDVTERTRAERALRESAERFQALSEAAFEGIGITEDGVFLEVNEQLTRMARCSRDDLIGRSVLDFVPPESSELARERMRLSPETPYRGLARRSDGSVFSFEAHGRSMPFRGRSARVTAFRDVTARQEMERALEESEARYRTVFEQGVVAVFLLKDLRFVECNSLCFEIFGGTREQLLGKTVMDVSPPIQPEGRPSEEMARERFEAALDGTPQHFEWLHHRLDGTPFYADVTLNRLELNGELHLQAVLADITERWESEKAVRSLRQRVLTAQEEERRRIARELHDELGQALTGVKMDLAWLTDHLRRDQPALQERASASLALIDGTLDEVRDLSTRLRPAVLDDLGLLSAIEWQARHFARRTGVDCGVSIGVDDLPLGGDRAIVVFRVFQEALTNVARHADASQVRVSVGTVEEQVVLEVRDDGRGVTDDELASHSSLGLIGMRERAAAFGGQVEVHRAEEGGTAVTLRVPLAGTQE